MNNKKLSAVFALVLTLGHTGYARAEPLTLEAALALAAEHSPLLAVEQGRAREAEADYDSARAGLLPKLSANAYANQLSEDRLTPGGFSLPPGSVLYQRESFAGVTARQLLFDGAKTSGARDAAAQGVAAGRLGAEAARVETVYRVRVAFYRALAARELVRVAEEALRRQRSFERLTANLFAAGKVTRLDTLEAESARVDAEKTLVAARETASLARAQLAQAIGVEAGAAEDPQGALPATFGEPGPEAELTRAARAHNLDLERASKQVRQAEANLASARGARYPEFSVQGSYGWRERDVGGGADEWLVGLSANWALYDGGAIAGQAGKAAARLTQARETTRAIELDLDTQVRDALRAWRTALSDAAAAAKLIESTSESLAAAETLYRAGKATALDVLVAQANLARAQGVQVTAAADYAAAHSRMARLTGEDSEEKQ